jgi:hypothetical protein
MKIIRKVLALAFIIVNLWISLKLVDILYDQLYLKIIPFEDYLQVDAAYLKRDFAQMNGVYIPALDQDGIYIEFDDTTDAYLHLGLTKGYYQILLYDDEVLLTELTFDFQYTIDQVLETGLDANQSYNGMVIIGLTDTDHRILYFETLESIDEPSGIEYIVWSKTGTLEAISEGNLDSNITKVQALVANLSEVTEDSIIVNFINVSNRDIEIIEMGQTGKSSASDIGLNLSSDDFGQVVKMEIALSNFDFDKEYSIYYRYTAEKVVLSIELSHIDNRNEMILEDSHMFNTSDDTFLSILREEDGYLYLKSDHTVLEHPLVIPSSYTFILGPGQSIEFINNAYLLSYSNLIWMGSEDTPIKIYSSVDSMSAISIIQANETSIIEHVLFEGLSAIDAGVYETTGSLNFYESDVQMAHVVIQDNFAEDALNIVRSTFEILNTSFINTYSDAFDSDFSNGTISYSLFSHTGNDGFDASGSEVNLSYVKFINIGDKGMSIGESSSIVANNIIIEKSDVGIAVKDGSSLELNTLELKDIYLGLVQYIKKPIFGHTTVFLDDLHLGTNIGLAYLFQEDETFYLDGERIYPNNLNKSDQIFDALIEEKELR